MERVNENNKEYRKGDSGPKYLFIGPRMDWGILKLKSGESLGNHFHNQVEETFFFPTGDGLIMMINDNEYQVKDGDAFRIEPGEKHNILNNTKNDYKIIFIKNPSLPEDKISCWVLVTKNHLDSLSK